VRETREIVRVLRGRRRRWGCEMQPPTTMMKIYSTEGQYFSTDKQVKYNIIEDPLRFDRDKGKP
jgi:hypothetical protein